MADVLIFFPWFFYIYIFSHSRRLGTESCFKLMTWDYDGAGYKLKKSFGQETMFTVVILWQYRNIRDIILDQRRDNVPRIPDLFVV